MTVREYLTPGSLPEALDLLRQHGPELLVMAGGTVAMGLLNGGTVMPERVMSLRLAGLDAIERDGDVLRIGAATTLTRLLAEDGIPLLAEAIRATGSWPIRNMATIGGNLFIPAPGGDVAVALLALDARLRIVGPGGARTLPVADFHTGFMTTALAPDELLAGVDVPTAPRETAFIKFGRKRANTPAVVTVAVALARSDGRVAHARISLGAVAPHPIRAREAEAVLEGSALEPEVIERAAQAAVREAQPATDAIATAWYRERMIPVIVGRALDRIRGDS